MHLTFLSHSKFFCQLPKSPTPEKVKNTGCRKMNTLLIGMHLSKEKQHQRTKPATRPKRLGVLLNRRLLLNRTLLLNRRLGMLLNNRLGCCQTATQNPGKLRETHL